MKYFNDINIEEDILNRIYFHTCIEFKLFFSCSYFFDIYISYFSFFLCRSFWLEK